MSTKIEWTDETWNVITGCTLVDEGCRNCYAAELAASRLKNHPSRAGLAKRNAQGVASFTGEVRFNEDWLDQPLHWKAPRMIFVCAHGDLFHPAVPDDWIDRVFAVMALRPRHTFQVLTKRPDRAREYLSNAYRRIMDIVCDLACDGEFLASYAFAISAVPEHDARESTHSANVVRLHQWPLPNVWLGTSVSDQASADARIPDLLETPAAKRFVSAEPLLGPVDLGAELISIKWGFDIAADCGGGSFSGERPGLDWVIVGGESGRRARPMHPDWPRSIRDQCQTAGTAFFFKQWGTFADHTETHANSQNCKGSHDLVILPNGSVIGGGAKGFGGMVDEDWRERGAAWMCHVGKKSAGRLLDGREWNEVPT